MDRWYFAYGSNLSIAQMVARTGPIRTGDHRPRIARLANYRLTFNMRVSDGEIYANIVAPGDGVYGVVYSCSELALKRLDEFEGGYDWHNVQVIDNGNRELTALAYIAQPGFVFAEGQPCAAYLSKILTGGREHGLPQEYLEAIEARARG